MTATDLFKAARPLTKDSLKYSSPYIHNALARSLSNYRLVSLGDVLAKDPSPSTLPKFVRDFLGVHGEVLVIANIVGKKVCSLILRALDVKAFITWGRFPSVPYGLGTPKKDFLAPIILVEGPLDRDSITHIYPNVLSVLTAGTSITQRAVIETITNSIILLYDSDEFGQKATRRDQKYFLSKGMITNVISLPKGIKDSGTLAELRSGGSFFEADYLESYLTSNIRQYL